MRAVNASTLATGSRTKNDKERGRVAAYVRLKIHLGGNIDGGHLPRTNLQPNLCPIAWTTPKTPQPRHNSDVRACTERNHNACARGTERINPNCFDSSSPLETVEDRILSKHHLTYVSKPTKRKCGKRNAFGTELWFANFAEFICALL